MECVLPDNIAFSDPKVKVLLIEDHPGDVLLFKHACKGVFANMDIVTANSVRTALAEMENQTFDVIFSDLNTSDSMGASPVSDLRKIVSDTPIIVLTGIATDITRQECKKAGANALLVKSDLNAHNILQVLEQIGFSATKIT